jgi:hypothetical protein
MTITLIVVAGLVLDRLTDKSESMFRSIHSCLKDNHEIIEKFRLVNEDQVQVNINIAKDIDELWGGQLESYIKHCQLETKLERISDDQVKVNVHLAEDIAKLQELLSFRLKEIKNKSRAKK